MQRTRESLRSRIEHESSVNQRIKNDIHSLDQLVERYRLLLIHALNNDPNKYASLDMCQKDSITLLLSI